MMTLNIMKNEQYKCHHTALFWKRRIKEMITQYNIFSKEKIDYEVIEKRIGNDQEKAINEYKEMQRIYVKFIKKNFIEKRQQP